MTLLSFENRICYLITEVSCHCIACLGPMVTPLARRRPVKVARETAALDLLSKSRLVFGVGLGGERFGEEFSKTGEELDDRVRGEMLDEGLEILTAAWSGEPVNHHGKHYLIDDVQFLPRPVQRPSTSVGRGVRK